MRITDKQLDALKALLPEWVFDLDSDGGLTMKAPTWNGKWFTPDYYEPPQYAGVDQLCGEIERAWLKREVEFRIVGPAENAPSWDVHLWPRDLHEPKVETAETKLAAYLSANAALIAASTEPKVTGGEEGGA